MLFEFRFQPLLRSLFLSHAVVTSCAFGVRDVCGLFFFMSFLLLLFICTFRRVWGIHIDHVELAWNLMAGWMDEQMVGCLVAVTMRAVWRVVLVHNTLLFSFLWMMLMTFVGILVTSFTDRVRFVVVGFFPLYSWVVGVR
ncbi:hypothetical protein EX30DRAFT_85534 [Ascodesmis nigricans]|uniref:Transmembrane protein n=1 Tax=Ascodesmis nigricans TaxID=341454 RepID=A0A4S2N3A9_9PEZI|nr:hypothetical protein EX30DRAFT_85534 [Ascodesmis nigricans]